ncbi:cationic amino acid transporter 4-like [Tropilaelaps mercedesae]|uniref:Cationic amino acid transporter 4-like n=1 Tax=Tropilaelaps mercedesae TaxID=418985 RepID=A0A1V9XSX2_9ACAR|nr:cationic amino acid transporter 4-like [Tropilaelaps mercedesae]
MRLLSRKKEVKAMDVMSTKLKRCLTSFDVTLLGIGHMLGSGIYVLSPEIARFTTGPALIISYLIAGVASLLAALAYADFGVRYPRSGSAYSYVYYSIGEFWAFFASAKCFFAYVGFDAIAAAGEEALNPQKSLPIATLVSMIVVTTLYACVAAVLTLMVYFADISGTSGLPEAMKKHDVIWAQYIVSIGAIAGMSTVIMATIFAMARTGYAMALDGLLFSPLATVQTKSQVPYVSMYISTLASGVSATFLDTEAIIDMLSIGTLLAYMLVSCALLISRYTLPKTQQLESSSTSHDTSKWTDFPNGDSNTHNLKPAFRFLKGVLPARYSQRRLVTGAFVVRYDGLAAAGPEWAVILCRIVLGLSVCFIIISWLLIFAHEISVDPHASSDQYNMPFVPVLPLLSILMNVILMSTLDWLTWLRLVIWLIIDSSFTSFHTCADEETWQSLLDCFITCITALLTATTRSTIDDGAAATIEEKMALSWIRKQEKYNEESEDGLL